jgi:hypothetical protein
MKFIILLTSIVSFSLSAPVNSADSDHQLNRRLLGGLFDGYNSNPYYGNGYGYGPYKPNPLVGVNLSGLSILSPKQKTTDIAIDEGAYNSYGYNPYAQPYGASPYGGYSQ